MIGDLFGRSDPQQRAGILNQIIQSVGAGEFYAEHPDLVKGLGAAALAIALGRMHSGQR
jgi:hypothetical protein